MNKIGYSEFYEARQIIQQILEQDLIGPVEEFEILSELPTQYYIMGKLYPQNNSVEIIDEIQNPILENDEDYDASISLSNQFNPASMAITVMLKANVESILISGSYAFYNPSEKSDSKKILWQREPYTFNEIFSFGKNNVIDLKGGLQLHIYNHSYLESDEKIITIALVNTNLGGNDFNQISKFCAFQPIIKVESCDGKAIFSNINVQKNIEMNSELMELDMLYSDVKCYAQGHGCATIWDKENNEPLWISSSFIPSFNLHQMKAADFENNEVLSMKFLYTAPVKEVVKCLKNFINGYQIWIEDLKLKLSNVKENLQIVALDNIKKCQQTYNRIFYSIELLESDPLAFRAFQLANEAMFMQRKQTILKSKKIFDEKNVRWYPFQLAFILQELPSFIEPKSDDRQIVDLLWFPTGGGKTEAYLGITAFVIFLRRLRNSNDDGVTVLTRYTLRLLTLQQFERSSILIFACELLRKKYNLGGNEISIGLWVGGGLTPNELKESRAVLRKLKAGAIVSSEDVNPYQVKICPWCGEKINVDDYSVDISQNRMMIKCHNKNCDFHNTTNGLPIHIIDEAIYTHLPTFIVATIDKFAQIPLNEKPAALFGITSNKKPPDLIIQDELHLISGPLGTITGIYEAAITKICELDGIGAKIIASTATIRNAPNQILNLYGKKYAQFPSQGISAKDSFFAVESTINEKPARLYIGVMGIGIAATSAMIRVYSSLLFATRYLVEKNFPDEVIDNFWTIVGYFNTLKELGGACTQIIDDVQARFNYLAKTKFSSKYPNVNTEEKFDNIKELTSRVNNSDITEIIQKKLPRSYTSNSHTDVYDFVLASNMISVGVDVGRLGLMAVVNQPKTNSEYIQATSRVGRNNPGLVITIYNGARSRDRSHYEQFLKYHSTLYRYVEATSLTPFSDRARDRGLHAIFVSLCRYLIPKLLKNNQASNFDMNDSNVKKIEKIILDYVKKVDSSEIEAVRNELKDIAETWEERVASDLLYKSWKTTDKTLLKKDTENDRFSMMNSMRNVDGQSGIYLLRGK